MVTIYDKYMMMRRAIASVKTCLIEDACGAGSVTVG